MRDVASLVEIYLAAERDLVAAVDALGGAVPLPDGRNVTVGHGIRQGGGCHLAKSLAAQPMANFAQLRSLGVRELQPPVQLAPQDSVFCGQMLIPQQRS
jgi:hypothetical protein